MPGTSSTQAAASALRAGESPSTSSRLCSSASPSPASSSPKSPLTFPTRRATLAAAALAFSLRRRHDTSSLIAATLTTLPLSPPLLSPPQPSPPQPSRCRFPQPPHPPSSQVDAGLRQAQRQSRFSQQPPPSLREDASHAAEAYDETPPMIKPPQVARKPTNLDIALEKISSRITSVPHGAAHGRHAAPRGRRLTPARLAPQARTTSSTACSAASGSTRACSSSRRRARSSPSAGGRARR
mmetsp:Transcript_40910/g.131578  ORF Transcript_40910/g.131578 Transcript_40910/m.131578 type:complete len:240 (-) Transcript_40910:177-896(-)